MKIKQSLIWQRAKKRQEFKLDNFKKFSEVNVNPIKEALAVQPDLWKKITVRQDWPESPHKDTECIWVRGPKTITADSVFNDIEAFDYGAMRALMPQIYLLMKPVLKQINSKKLGRILIVNLKAGGKITEHSDEGKYADYYERFHIPLTSKEGNLFWCGDECIHMEVGNVWWFNHKKLHKLENNSNESRIHLIFDAVIDKEA
jgi:hypothetical protein